MKRIRLLYLFILAICCTACHTYTLSNNKKERQFMPTKERNVGKAYDTASFIKLPFQLEDYTTCKGYRNSKRVIVPLNPSDMIQILNQGERYHIYIEYTTCPAMITKLARMDSMVQAGEHVLLISTVSNYNEIDKLLKNTSFTNYPIYTIEDRAYSNVVLRKKIEFINGFCDSCYSRYKDDLRAAKVCTH